MEHILALWVVVLFGTASACVVALGHNLCGRRRVLDGLVWGSGGLLFAGLATARVIDLEDRARRALRASVRSEGLYTDRWDFQAVAVAAVVALAGLGLLLLWLGWEKGWLKTTPRPVLGALVGLVAMVGLIFLRLISLHGVDQVLYGGGLHINGLLEAVLTLGTALCGLRYVQRSHQARRAGRSARS